MVAIDTRCLDDVVASKLTVVHNDGESD